jgi:hypothetical protein
MLKINTQFARNRIELLKINTQFARIKYAVQLCKCMPGYQVTRKSICYRLHYSLSCTRCSKYNKIKKY